MRGHMNVKYIKIASLKVKILSIVATTSVTYIKKIFSKIHIYDFLQFIQAKSNSVFLR
jgi:hypothetical protein